MGGHLELRRQSLGGKSLLRTEETESSILFHDVMHLDFKSIFNITQGN